jgi:hypothetical protein
MVNGEEFDLATDVYTLGLVFIELLSRKLAARWLFTVRPSPWRQTGDREALIPARRR